jgi:4-hydroxybenzoate polyprenyltransferase
VSRDLHSIPSSADHSGSHRPWTRWWIYQKERFPLAAHGPLIAAFTFCAVAISVRIRGALVFPYLSFAVAFVTCTLIFFQLRVADEFKDFEEDSKYRPYRAVPRGLVTLRELGWMFVVAAVIQLILALWLSPRLVILLGLVWTYLGLMSREFFFREYLKQRPILYLISHMLIMPLVDLYATGTDWFLHESGFHPALMWFLAASFFNGMSLEIGRKIRHPEQEETGVQTYSALWGQNRAVVVWWSQLLLSMICGLFTAGYLNAPPLLGLIYVLLLIAAAFFGRQFLLRKTRLAGRSLELTTFLWTLSLYLGLGILPWFRVLPWFVRTGN